MRALTVSHTESLKIRRASADTTRMEPTEQRIEERNADSPPAAFHAPRRQPTFPGGRVRLPRLEDRPVGAQPEVAFVGTAFVRRHAVAEEVPQSRSGFAEYYTYESLFEDVPDDEATPDDPYSVLRVSREDPWPKIVAAHRRLAKEFHPDRFVEQSADIVRQAELETKRINEAYATLRLLHQPNVDS